MNQRVAEALRNTGLSVKELAHKLNVSEKTVKLWLSGLYTPNCDSMRRIAKVTNVSLLYLMCADEEKYMIVTGISPSTEILINGIIELDRQVQLIKK